MWAFLASALAAIPSAATSTFSLIAFALAIAAYVFIVWRVIRNKNLLQHLQKLPPKDRLGALETELGGVRLAAGLSPEQWLRSKMHKYYLLAFLATCGVVGVTSTLAIMNRSPVPGTTYINSSTVFQNQVQQIVGQSVIDPELKQKIERAIESGAKRDFQTAVNLYEQIPENMRVPAVWNNLGVAYLGLGDQPRARAAFEKARERNPNDDAANANLSHLNKVAAFTPAAPQDASSQPKPAEGQPVRVEAQAKQPT
jgi:tetratricopeptide (TPR) repeat protein